MSTFNGSNLRVFVAGALVAEEQNCTFNLSHEPRDANSKDSGRWDNSEEGPLSGEFSGEGLVPVGAEDVLDALYDKLVGTEVIQVVIGTNNAGSVDETKHRWIMNARFTSLEDNGPHREGRKYSFAGKSVGIVTSWNPNS
jgi:hypothetical protein